MDTRGFTIIELVMVLVLTAIVAAVAVPMMFRGTGSVGVNVLARKVADDLRYAQSLALRRDSLDTPPVTNPVFRYRVSFNVADTNCAGADHYTITNDADNNGTWGENPNGSAQVESPRNPADGSTYFCIRLNTGDYAGITASVDFGGSVAGIVEFNNTGTPYDSDGVKLTAVKTVTITDGTESASITVTPETGMVAIQ